jgi:glycosidase
MSDAEMEIRGQDPDLISKAEITWQRLYPRLKQRSKKELNLKKPEIKLFNSRLKQHYADLFVLYYQLYRGKYDFYFHLEDLLFTLLRMWSERSDNLKALDETRLLSTAWYLSNQMLGGVCYVDLYAGDLEGIRRKIPYFKELGLTYLHLMPIYRVPIDENDGGYAVSSYRDVAPSLGTMDQLVLLADELKTSGISLVLDFVFNHTSDDHEWALRAKQGERQFQDFYWFFSNRTMPDAYEKHLREIFPDTKKAGIRSGAFTYNAQIEKWVWTTFHSFQWDLNYQNPEVFNRMVEEMLFLANCGVEVLRLDAVAFIWKELGTDCENLPQAHLLIEAFNLCARISAPALLFKSEAIVHPDEVMQYISTSECQISYNPLLMALLWESLATRKVELLHHSLASRFELETGCSWINYIRSHDDIGWTFSEQDAVEISINGFDHRRFLNDFYTGIFTGSFARGLPFQYNPITGDSRICGTCASLAGLEKALSEETSMEVELAMRRILLIYSIVLTIGGIPLIYLGDELGTLNDYSYKDDPAKAKDNRWVHRPKFDDEKFENRLNRKTIPGELYQRFSALISFRKNQSVFNGNSMTLFETGNIHVFGYTRTNKNETVAVMANFSEKLQSVNKDKIPILKRNQQLIELSSKLEIKGPEIYLEPYQFLCLE